MKKSFIFLLLITWHLYGYCQLPAIPSSYANVHYDENGRLYFQKDGLRYFADTSKPRYTIEKLLGNAAGTADGIALDFGSFKGTITYGMIPYGKAPHPLPVFRFTLPLKEGKVSINIKTDFRSAYDFVGWAERKQFVLGYRLMDEKGLVVFDGEIAAEGTGPFTIVPAIYEGPFVSNITDKEAVIWYNTTQPCISHIEV
ncbi:MAG: hypothetical protein JNK98_06470, partial [Chitinophagaceae bacterium]|nr:hypothetical protein [Chitinophagaceae bacterium]